MAGRAPNVERRIGRRAIVNRIQIDGIISLSTTDLASVEI